MRNDPEVRTLAFVDCQQLFFGLKRVTGRHTDRIDYVKLRSKLGSSSKDMFFAYIISPLAAAGEGKKIPLHDESKFIRFLTGYGYTVRRHFAKVEFNRADMLQFSNTSAIREMTADSIRYMPEFDRIVLASGSGSMIGLADRAHELGKNVVVASFSHAGDLNRELEAKADVLYQLDASFRYARTSR